MLGGIGEPSVSVPIRATSHGERLRTHLAPLHADAPGGTPSRCGPCDISFARPDILARHVRLHHSGDREASSLEVEVARGTPVPAPVPVGSAPAAETRSRYTGPHKDDAVAVEAGDLVAESPDALWRLPIPPSLDVLPDSSGASGSDSTFEEFQATLLSFDNAVSAAPNRLERGTSPCQTVDTAAEIPLPWDFPRFESGMPSPSPQSTGAPTKRPRIRSPTPIPGLSKAPVNRPGPLDDSSLSDFITTTGNLTPSSPGLLSSPPTSSRTDSDCSYSEQLFSLPSTLPRIRAAEIMGSRELRPRHLAIQIPDEPDADWTHEDYEDGTGLNWLQGAIVRPKEPSMYPGIDQ